MMIAYYKKGLIWLDSQADILPLAARFVFAAVLAGYFWASAATKMTSFPFGVAFGSYGQIFPRAFEAAGYNAEAMGLYHKAVVLLATYAEFLLPLLIIIGLMTRLAAFGMIVFVMVQSLTDVLGHKAGPETIGAWFDRDSAALIMDQRLLWIFLLMLLVLRGAGPLSLDRFAAQRLLG